MRAIAPGELDQARRAGRGPADGVNQRKVLLHEIVADDAAEVSAKARREPLRRQRQFFRTHVVGWRIDEIAGQRRGVSHPRDVCGIDCLWRRQLHLGYIGVAITVEAIAAERKRQHGKSGVVRRVGEAIDARRKQAW